MPKDLREMLQDKPISGSKLSRNHRRKFEAKLKRELQTSSSKSKFSMLKIAASVLLVIGLGSSAFYFFDGNIKSDQTAKIENLGSISPELGKIENYYLASIHSEISSLEETPQNKELLNDYLEKIDELTTDYKALTEELNNEGLNENTINALIDNLQLRLKLLYQLKEHLDELKNLNLTENENLQA